MHYFINELLNKNYYVRHLLSYPNHAISCLLDVPEYREVL